MINIKQRQLNLKYNGYFYPLDIDGIEGKYTKDAYKKFQKFYGMKETGIYDSKIEKYLKMRTRYLQHLLIYNDCYVIVDGLIGEKTIDAIKKYQASNGLIVDGIVGKNTMKSLENSILKDIKHFKLNEFDCPCCHRNLMNVFMIDLIEEIRNHYGKPITITSGFRCEKKNNSLIGHDINSRHLFGSAIDFYVSGISTHELLEFCYSLRAKGIIRYCYTNNTNMRGAVHIDFDE